MQVMTHNTITTKQNVLIISSLGPLPYLGGIENVIKTLVESSLSESYNFSFFDTFRTPDPERTFFAKLAFALRLPFQCAHHIYKNQPKIIHIHFCSRTDFWKHSICLIVAKTLRIKSIFHLHGGSFNSVYKEYHWIKKYIVRFILSQPDMVIALSRYWKEFLSDLTEKDKIRIAPNPINCKELTSYNKYNWKKKERTILLLGSLGKRKGHFDVIKAAPLVLAKHPDTYFCFAGQDEDLGATEQLKKLAQKYKITNNIHFLGPVTGVEKLKLLGETNIIILPSYAENMPISVLEGMAANKPVISTRVGAIPEVITNNESGLLIDAGDWKNLAKKIILLLDNPDFSIQLGIKAEIIARNNWDIKNVSSIIDNLYQELIHEKK